MHCVPNVEFNHFAAFNEFAMLLNSLSQLFFTFIDRLFCFPFKRSRFREAIQTGLIGKKGDNKFNVGDTVHIGPKRQKGKIILPPLPI